MSQVVLIMAMVLYVLFFFLMVYLCILADPAESPLSRLLTEDIPNGILKLLERCIGPKVGDSASRMSNYLCYEPNPVLQIVYLIIVLGSWSIMFTYGYILMPEYLKWHKYSGYVLFVLCMWSWRKTCNAPPGFITARSLAKYDNYPYDELLFTARICPTVNIRKLARSKYDRMSKAHIARFDHFCAWINQPVGEDNYRYFLTFLFVHVFMCWYGAIITALIFMNEVQEKDLLNVTFIDARTGESMKATKFIVFQFILARYMPLAGILLLMSVMAVMLTGFLGFHVYLISKGMTTNEYYKWSQIKQWHKESKKKYAQVLKDGKAGPPHDQTSSGTSFEGPFVSASTKDEMHTVETTPVGNGKINVPEKVLADVDVGCTGGAPPTNDEPSKEDNKSGKKQEGDLVEDPGPLINHLYDLGFVENIREVFFPRSLRPPGQRKWKKSGYTEINATEKTKTH